MPLALTEIPLEVLMSYTYIVLPIRKLAPLLAPQHPKFSTTDDYIS
jgi:hypothetical protein